MPRSAVPWSTRAVERQMEIGSLLAQCERIERAVEARRSRAELLVAEAEKQIALAGRLEVLEHQALVKAIREQRVLTGIFEHPGRESARQAALA